jgi:DNA-binding transcriptional LysR family regulator
MSLDEIGLFAAVAREGTFAAAARQLGVPKSTLSRAITRLEARTGVPLLYRAARSFTLTEAGRRFFAAVEPHVTGLGEAARSLRDGADEPEGTLRISAPLASGDLIGEALVHFRARYPRVGLDVEVSSRKVELVREGFDVALRGTPSLRGDGLTARRLTIGLLGLYAAPTHLARRGVPLGIDDVATHPLLAHAPSLRAAPLRPLSLQAAFSAASVAVDEFGLLRSMLRAGAGIGMLPAAHAALDLEAGRLVRVLPEWSHLIGALYLVFPTARRLPRKVAVFRDFMVEAFTTPPRGSARGGSLLAR